MTQSQFEYSDEDIRDAYREGYAEGYESGYQDARDQERYNSW